MISRVEDLPALAGSVRTSPRVVVAGAHDRNVLQSVLDARAAGHIEATLIGPARQIQSLAQELNADLDPFRIIDQQQVEGWVETAISCIRDGQGDILMKGRLSTRALMRRVVDRGSGLRTRQIISHVALLTAPEGNRILLLTDAGINIAPNLNRKSDIILNAVAVAKALGISEPKVALLAFVEKASYPSAGSAPEQAATDAAILTELNRQGALPGCVVEGPYGLDNAISPEAARVKEIEGRVAGQADILVAHDINMGNVIYKTLQVWQKMVFASVVAGCRIPIIVPSRADSRQTKLHSIALAVFLYNHNSENQACL